MIYKTFYGKYIDLSKLVAVSEAYHIDRMGCGGYFVAFDMHFQLMETPITYTREVELTIDLTMGYPRIDYNKRLQESMSACDDLQKQIDVLILDWKKYKGE